MSIKIIKKGLSDTIQDSGRYGYQHFGIPPCGYMDYLSAQLANLIVQNPLTSPVFELHFPASSFEFNDTYLICISGANFVPVINNCSVPLNQPIQVNKNDLLQFLEPIQGKIAYLAVQGKIKDEPWLNSYSFFSKTIGTNDSFQFESLVSPIKKDPALLSAITMQIQDQIFSSTPIHFIPGPAWNDLTSESIQLLLNNPFATTLQNNRMGYHLKGPLLQLSKSNNYLSSGLTRGTMQLLPSGELLILMADHQTIGGYANLGQIILVDLPKLAQLKVAVPFNFKLTQVQNAQNKYKEIQQWFNPKMM